MKFKHVFRKSYHLIRQPSLATVSALAFSFAFGSMNACSTKEKPSEGEEAVARGAEGDQGAQGEGKDKDKNKTKNGAAEGHEPALAVSTVASLISVADVMVREPERFQKALCSDGNIYDLDFEGGRFSLRAEPLSVCVLLSDSKDLKPLGFCGNERCTDTPTKECSDQEKKEFGKSFAKEQIIENCQVVGEFLPYSFTVLVSRVGQSCQAQTLVKTEKTFKQLGSIDGLYEKRGGGNEGPEKQGCSFEAGPAASFAGDWFGRDKKIVPVMAFQKDGGAYALLKTTFSGSESFQLFRVDGDKLMEVESFAEAFKEPPPPAPEPKGKGKDKGKAKTGSEKKAKKKPSNTKAAPASSPSPSPSPSSETPNGESPNDAAPKTTPSGDDVPEGGVNPLDG